MRGSRSDSEHTFALASRALELMKAYGSSASPRSYAVWYTYVAGLSPHLNDALKRITTEHGVLSEANIDLLHETYLDGRSVTNQVEQTSSTVITEINDIMEMLDLALGSTAKYGESLETFSADLAAPSANRGRVREIVSSLVVATREVSATNRTLEARMLETRNEVEGLRETLEAVRVEALTDPLTGLANRKHFEEMLVKGIDNAAVQRSALSLIVIDIDHFKRFNDTYGHLTGDQVLRLVGIAMREQVKTRATLARFGGEEFGIVLPDTDQDAARVVAERIRTNVMGRELVKRSTGESLGKVTISVGVATVRRGDTSVSLLERSDQCMFAAKRAGRNRTVDDSTAPEDALPVVA